MWFDVYTNLNILYLAVKEKNKKKKSFWNHFMYTQNAKYNLFPFAVILYDLKTEKICTSIHANNSKNAHFDRLRSLRYSMKKKTTHNKKKLAQGYSL